MKLKHCEYTAVLLYSLFYGEDRKKNSQSKTVIYVYESVWGGVIVVACNFYFSCIQYNKVHHSNIYRRQNETI